MTKPQVSWNKGKGKSLPWLQAHVGYAGEDCLKWPFGGANGYGTLGVNGRVRYAHRVMCELANGPSPSPTHEASHSCGNGHKGCVNPRHLSWKTPRENQLDRARHGTKATGPYGKIDQAMADLVRAMRSTHLQREIAAMFGISRSNVSLIQNGNTWRPDKQKYLQRPKTA